MTWFGYRIRRGWFAAFLFALSFGSFTVLLDERKTEYGWFMPIFFGLLFATFGVLTIKRKWPPKWWTD